MSSTHAAPFVVVMTGPDGAGKSTLSKSVAELITIQSPHLKVRRVSIWDGLPSSKLFRDKGEVMQMLRTLGHEERSRLLFVSMESALARAERERPDVMIVEGHWYKYAVSEIGQGTSRDQVLRTLNPLSQRARPNLVFFLDIDPELAQARKLHLSPYECGLNEANTNSFVSFQRKLKPVWAYFEAREGPWVHLDARASVKDNAARVMRRMRKIDGSDRIAPVSCQQSALG